MLLTERLIADSYCHLRAYEWAGGKSLRDVHPLRLRERFANIDQTDLRACIERIPARQFVWSDELAKAHDNLLHDHYSRDDLAPEDEILWTPDISDFEDLLKECPSFLGLQDSVHARTAERMTERDTEILRLAKEYKKKNKEAKCWSVAAWVSRQPSVHPVRSRASSSPLTPRRVYQILRKHNFR